MLWTAVGGGSRTRRYSFPESSGSRSEHIRRDARLTTPGGRQAFWTRLVDDTVSERHARIGYDSGTLFAEDLGSRNGTFINGARVSAGD